MNFSFHKPYKDLCKICETYRSSKEENFEIHYNRHISEKEETRRLRLESKALSKVDGSLHVAACFDLQQVIYLPKSPRSEIFYKRRLSNYNFTIFNLKDSSVDCFLWHEVISGRGANEIASCVYKFLLAQDDKGVETVDLFCDGCAGQNKNSIFPAMLQHFLSLSKCTKEVRLVILVPSHGHNENDSVHVHRESFEKKNRNFSSCTTNRPHRKRKKIWQSILGSRAIHTWHFGLETTLSSHWFPSCKNVFEWKRHKLDKNCPNQIQQRNTVPNGIQEQSSGWIWHSITARQEEKHKRDKRARSSGYGFEKDQQCKIQWSRITLPRNDACGKACWPSKLLLAASALTLSARVFFIRLSEKLLYFVLSKEKKVLK